MKRVCAWCNQEMGTMESDVHPEGAVSHGICTRCTDNMKFQEGVPVQAYLDSFPVPVVVIAISRDRSVVKSVNRSACSALGKEPQEMVQHLAGNVFECSHARLPEGCGKTIHCSACTIRRTVFKTHQTGEPQSLVPALLKRDRSGDGTAVSMFISTVKAGTMVMLRIDTMDISDDE